MEASVTTDTIQDPKPKRARQRTGLDHSHGPNFGRYVAGCSGCIARWPDGPPVRSAKKKSRNSAAEIEARVAAQVKEQMAALLAANPMPVVEGVTMEQVQALLAANAQQTQSSGAGLSMEQLMAFAAELRKPDPEVVAEKEAAKARLIEVRRTNALAAKAQMESDALRRGSCSHKMPRGENAISGQQHSDGMVHPICVICQKEFPPYRPAAEQMSMGLA